LGKLPKQTVNKTEVFSFTDFGDITGGIQMGHMPLLVILYTVSGKKEATAF